jgi:hypothetical protein
VARGAAEGGGLVRAIWKYTLVAPVSSVAMPPGRVLEVHQQDGLVCVWAEVERDQEAVLRTFHALNTGDDIPDGLSYCGTAFVGEIVWHVYEEVAGDG